MKPGTAYRQKRRRATPRGAWGTVWIALLVMGACAATIAYVMNAQRAPTARPATPTVDASAHQDRLAASPSASQATPHDTPAAAPALVPAVEAPPPGLIAPGELWPDNRGRHIQAHGGGIIKVRDTYYWYGVDMSADIPKDQAIVACYASRDLMNWSFRGNILTLEKPEDYDRSRWVLERPKIYFNEPTQKFVMYMHLDNALGTKHAYEAAEVGIATCDSVDGTYAFLRKFRPFGNQSRDIGQFVDDDGKAYLISEDRERGFHLYQLSNDFLSIERDVCLFPEFLEGGGIVHHDGLYYFVGSHLTGWDPNPNVYATATSLRGPWSSFKDIAPPYLKTYGSQSTFLLSIVGTKATTVVFMGDLWNPKALWDSRYLWMPLEIGQGRLRLPGPQAWNINVATGEHRLLAP